MNASGQTIDKDGIVTNDPAKFVHDVDGDGAEDFL